MWQLFHSEIIFFTFPEILFIHFYFYSFNFFNLKILSKVSFFSPFFLYFNLFYVKFPFINSYTNCLSSFFSIYLRHLHSILHDNCFMFNADCAKTKWGKEQTREEWFILGRDTSTDSKQKSLGDEDSRHKPRKN